MTTVPLPDSAVQKAREASDALIEVSNILLHDLRHNQRDLEHLLDAVGDEEGVNK